MLPAWIRSRQVFLGIFLATALMMGFGYGLQYAEGLEPCPLCMTQRIFYPFPFVDIGNHAMEPAPAGFIGKGCSGNLDPYNG